MSAAQQTHALAFTRCDVQLGGEPTAITAAGFDGAGNPILAVLDGAPGANRVFVVPTDPTLFSQLRCDAATAGTTTVSVGSLPKAIAAGDVDGDRIVDLVVAEQAGVLILRGSTSGVFTPDPSPLAAGIDPEAVAVADIDGDGKPDIVGGNGNGNSVTILYGPGFSRNQTLAITRPVSSLAVGLLNADALVDIAAGSNVTSEVALLFQNPGHTFASPVSFNPGGAPSALVTADFNGDTKPDLAAAVTIAEQVNVYQGPLPTSLPTPQMTPAASPATGTNPSALAAGDLNGDGLPDAVVTNQDDNTVSFFLGSRDLMLVPDPGMGNCNTQDLHGSCTVGAMPDGIVAADVDGAPLDLNDDGHGDVVTANKSGSVTFLLSGQPSPPPSPTASATSTRTAAATPTPSLTATPGGPCCQQHAGPSCGSGPSDPCAACVCALLPSCCSGTWTDRCANLAMGAESSSCGAVCRCGEPTATATGTPTQTLTATVTDTPTLTPTGPTATSTFTPTLTPTPSVTLLPTATATVTPTATNLPTSTPISTITGTATPQCFAGGVCIQGSSCAISSGGQRHGNGAVLLVPLLVWLADRWRRHRV